MLAQAGAGEGDCGASARLPRKLSALRSSNNLSLGAHRHADAAEQRHPRQRFLNEARCGLRARAKRTAERARRTEGGRLEALRRLHRWRWRLPGLHRLHRGCAPVLFEAVVGDRRMRALLRNWAGEASFVGREPATWVTQSSQARPSNPALAECDSGALRLSPPVLRARTRGARRTRMLADRQCMPSASVQPSQRDARAAKTQFRVAQYYQSPSRAPVLCGTLAPTLLAHGLESA